MGTDISIFVEKRINGLWEDAGFRNIYNSRNYCLFTVLADAGRYYKEPPPIKPPRGIPTDITKDIKAALLEDSVWGFSWLTLKEILDYNWELTIKDNNIATTVTVAALCEDFLKQTVPILMAIGEPENVRIVFGFDG